MLCHNAERELAEAKAEIERLHLRFAKWLDTHSQLVADAEIGRLVRGMREHTSLRCIATGSAPSYYQSKTHSFAGSRVVSGTTNDPAEALRAIQEVGDGEA